MTSVTLRELVQRTDTFKFQIIVFVNTQGPAAYKPLLSRDSWNPSTSAGFQIGILCVSQKSSKRHV